MSLARVRHLTNLVLDAFGQATVCHLEVAELAQELLLHDLDPFNQGLVRHPHSQSFRSSVHSLQRWLQLASTVQGATPEQVARLLEVARAEMARAWEGYPPCAAGVQNWYLDPTIGTVDSVRAKLISAVPLRTVDSNGSRAKSFRLPADGPHGPGSSPPGQVVNFPTKGPSAS